LLRPLVIKVSSAARAIKRQHRYRPWPSEQE
jgi:hypothetical protein